MVKSLQEATRAATEKKRAYVKLAGVWLEHRTPVIGKNAAGRDGLLRISRQGISTNPQSQWVYKESSYIQDSPPHRYGRCNRLSTHTTHTHTHMRNSNS